MDFGSASGSRGSRDSMGSGSTGDPASEKPIISLKDITKVYKMGKQSLKVLDGVSFEVEKGDFIAILGPSGSGKSTLMNIMGCIDIATEGEYVLDGKNIKARNEDELAVIRNQKIGFIFQKFNLLMKYTALHNTEIPLILRGVSRKEARERAMSMLAAVGLEDRVDHKPTELSGGQQQRVAIARALVGAPDLLLADEPTGNLDSKSGQEIMALFEQLHKDGHTIVLITHDLNVARRAKRILHVRDGKILEDERVGENVPSEERVQ
ncbi:ABC transporter ATP-binding protein [Acidaminobacter hydrogenoformans]|nr:ABC transporter ATP-binding protein [Acidaminobacter hydrogenoformans]